MDRDRPLLARCCSAAVGVTAVLLAIALLRSLHANPDAPAYELFISELAASWRAGSTLLNASFMASGSALALALLAVAGAWPQAHTRLEWMAVVGAFLTGLLIVSIGVFSVPAIEIHNPLAAVLLGVAFTTTWLIALVLRRRGHALARACGRVAWLQTICLVAAMAYVLPIAADHGVAEVPHRLDVMVGQRRVNPLAVLEWVFFGLVAAVALASAAAVGRAAAPAPTNKRPPAS